MPDGAGRAPFGVDVGVAVREREPPRAVFGWQKHPADFFQSSDESVG